MAFPRMFCVCVAPHGAPDVSLLTRSRSDQGPGNNTLQGANYTDPNSMTEEGCVAYCDARGYIYAGLEYAYECCESSLSKFGMLADAGSFHCQIVVIDWS